MPEIERCLAAREQAIGKGHPATSDAMNTLGIVSYRAGRYPEARFQIQRALQARQEFVGGLRGVALESLNDLGVILRAQGDLIAARRSFERILKEKNLESFVRRTAEANLAVILIELGDYDEAKRLLAGARQAPSKRPDIATLLNLGAIALAQGDDAEAERLFRKVLEAAPENIVALNSLGAVARKRGNLDEAARLFERALELGSKIRVGLNSFNRSGAPTPHDVVVTRVSLGLLQARRGDFDAALGHLNEAVAIYKQVYGGNHPRVADTIRRLGIVQLLAGRRDEARASLEEALRIKVAMADNFVPVLSESESLAFLATLTERDPLLAALRDQKGSTESAYDVVWSTRAIISRALAERVELADRDPRAAKLLDRLRAVRSRLSALTLHPELVRGSQAQASQALLALNEEKQQIERDLAEVCEPFRRQREQSRWRFPDLARRLPGDVAIVDLVQYADWSDRDATLKSGQPPSRYAAFVLRRADSQAGYYLTRVELGLAEAIDRDVKAWRGSIQAGVRGRGRGFRIIKEGEANSETDPVLAPRRLRDRVWAPLEAHLGGASTIVVIPEGTLTRLPWGALPGKTSAGYLIEDYALATASSGQDLLNQLVRQEPAGARSVIVGGIFYDDPPATEGPASISAQSRPVEEVLKAWSYLPGTRLEIDQIAHLTLPGADLVVLGRSDASEPAMRKILPQAHLAHLATHGFFAESRYRSVLDQPPALDPIALSWGFVDGSGLRFEPTALLAVSGRNPLVLSGVVVAGANLPPRISDSGLPDGADGILTGEEVASLDLRCTQLVVLSACDTGLGEMGGGEGVFGLQRAFHLAGARTTIASLWKVDDAATEALMVEFYRNLWQKRLGSLEALRQAQVSMIHRYDPRTETLRASGSSRPGVISERENDADRLSPNFWAAFVLSGDWR